MTKIVLEIVDCQGCPFFKAERVYTGDNFEDVWKGKCNKKHGKIIGTHESFDKPKPVPDWCPIKL